MNRINLLFQTYGKQTLDCKAYFDDILNDIYSKNPSVSLEYKDIYIPISHSEAVEFREKGRMVLDSTQDTFPSVLIKQLKVSFVNQEDLDSVLELHGNKANFYQIIEEQYIRDIT